jgi:hypothetical protein
VITELQWNDNEDPTRKYRVEVDFITAQEWGNELDGVFRDVAESYNQGENMNHNLSFPHKRKTTWYKIQSPAVLTEVRIYYTTLFQTFGN